MNATTTNALPTCPWPIDSRESLSIAADYALELTLFDERAAAEWLLGECGLFTSGASTECPIILAWVDSGDGTLIAIDLDDPPESHFFCTRMFLDNQHRRLHEPLTAFVVRAIAEIRGWT